MKAFIAYQVDLSHTLQVSGFHFILFTLPHNLSTIPGAHVLRREVILSAFRNSAHSHTLYAYGHRNIILGGHEFISVSVHNTFESTFPKSVGDPIQ
jgi:hypothetical protein